MDGAPVSPRVPNGRVTPRACGRATPRSCQLSPSVAQQTCPPFNSPIQLQRVNPVSFCFDFYFLSPSLSLKKKPNFYLERAKYEVTDSFNLSSKSK